MTATRLARMAAMFAGSYGAFVFGATAASGQTISGQVVDSTSRSPVGTGFVVLIDGAGRELIRTLTTAQGRFSVEIGPTVLGPFRLRSERIGYRQFTSPPIEVARDETLEYQLVVGALPVRLAAIDVEEDRQCRTRPAEGRQTAVVWEEARKALAAASWAADRGIYRYQSVLYERQLDARRHEVIEERTRVSAGYYKTPFSSQDPEVLVEDGFVVLRDGDNWYYAPDANVLRSEAFLGTHCFRVVREEKDRPGQIGLAFKPVPGRDLPDIDGTLWLDEETAELRSVDYRYTDEPNDIRDNRIGGTVEFMPVGGGAWIVNKWQIRMPAMALIEVKDARMARGTRQEVVMNGFLDAGGEVVEITSRLGQSLYQAPVSHVTGEVFDSARVVPAPLSRATVRVAGTSFHDTTDFRGRFEITAPLSGNYRLTFDHPRTDSLGFVAPERAVELRPGHTERVDLAIPPMPVLLEGICGDQDLDRESRILVGLVWDGATGAPFAGATVSARWQSIGAGREGTVVGRRFQELEATAVTDSHGFYAICTLELDRPAYIVASRANRRSTPTRVVFEYDGVAVGNEFYHNDRIIWKLDIALLPGTD